MSGTTEPQKHPTFHRNSMIVAFIIGSLVFSLGGIAIYAENVGYESPIPDWITVTMIILLIGWMLYRALIARPRCPICGLSDTKRQSDYNEKQKGSRNPQTWRCYRCPSCEIDFLVPGLSLDD